jgi:hypothetical protein
MELPMLVFGVQALAHALAGGGDLLGQLVLRGLQGLLHELGHEWRAVVLADVGVQLGVFCLGAISARRVLGLGQ